MPIRACFLFSACVFAAHAQFAVEIPGPKGLPPTYVTVGSPGIFSVFHDPAARAGKQEGRKPSALKLSYAVEGESVVITASVFFGEYDRLKSPVSLNNLPEEQAGTYSAGLNESVTLTGIEKFGLEPMTLRIVPAKSAAATRPQTVSKAPSIQIEITGEDRTFYHVALHNLSTKTVTGFTVDVPRKDGSSNQTESGPHLIAAGATHHFQFSIPVMGRRTNAGYVGDGPPLTMVLEAATFEDGSYEGDVDAAAQIGAGQLAREIQQQRIFAIVDAIVADAQADDVAKVARIRSEVASLTEDPEPRMFEALWAKFPGLSDKSLKGAGVWLKSGLRQGKQSTTYALDEFERARTTYARSGTTLAIWWNSRKVTLVK